MVSRRTMLKAGAAGMAALPVMAPPRTETLDAALDGFSSVASGVLAEVRDARWVWRGTRGVAELGTSRPVPAGGRFRAGSITKTFVATVVLQLAGERRLGLDDTVGRWLPGLVAGGDRITLRHLLQHTSGIPDYTRTDRFAALFATAEHIVARRFQTWRPRELLAFAADEPAAFEPGGGPRYSNTNYIVLALVIERVTGTGFRAEVARRISHPLRLRDTVLPGTDPAIAGPHAHGYLPGAGDTPVDITVFNQSVAGAAGELLSSAADLNHFYGSLLSGRLLRPAQLTEMLTWRVTGDTPQDYGLGLHTRLLPGGLRIWGHGGDTFGYRSASWSTRDGRRRLTVAVNPWGDAGPAPLIDGLIAAAFAAG